MRLAEYIWIGGNGQLRSKTRTISDIGKPPEWTFDGSSTEQASGDSSDCVLKPVKVVPDPLRPLQPGKTVLVLCEVFNADGTPGKNNYRTKTVEVYEKYKAHIPMFGIEQEYTLCDDIGYLGWKYRAPPVQGPFYCGVGLGKEYGSAVAEGHMFAALTAGLKWCGKNAEVMPGQWEFQIGPGSPLEVADDLWLARFLLNKVAMQAGYKVTLDPKPHVKLNGAGAHTNFSTKEMRAEGGLIECVEAAKRLGKAVAEKMPEGPSHTLEAYTFPEEYGSKYQQRLTGEHETCNWKQFKYGVADRTASIRIPLHVSKNGSGYIEDRRPCADADPYRVVRYIMETVCD